MSHGMIRPLRLFAISCVVSWTPSGNRILSEIWIRSHLSSLSGKMRISCCSSMPLMKVVRAFRQPAPYSSWNRAHTDGQAFVCNKRGLGMCIWRQGHMLLPHIELPSVRMFRYQVRFLPGWHGMQFRQYGVWLRCQIRDTGLSVPVYGPRQTWHQIRQQWVRFEFFLHESIKLLDLREPTPFQHPFSFSADTEDRFPCISTAA